MPDYCSECNQAVSHNAKIIEVLPVLLVIPAFVLYTALPFILRVDTQLIYIWFQALEPTPAYSIYYAFLLLGSLGFLMGSFYFIGAKVRYFYRRGLRISFAFSLPFHIFRKTWLQEPKPDASHIV